MTSIFEKRVSLRSRRRGGVHNIDSHFLIKINIENFLKLLGRLASVHVRTSFYYCIGSWRRSSVSILPCISTACCARVSDNDAIFYTRTYNFFIFPNKKFTFIHRFPDRKADGAHSTYMRHFQCAVADRTNTVPVKGTPKSLAITPQSPGCCRAHHKQTKRK